jgi:ribosomal protein S27E
MITTIAGCNGIQTIFSNAQTVVACNRCNAILCQPTGGKVRLTEGELKLRLAFIHYEMLT